MEPINKIEILISSPGDVAPQRKIVTDVCNQWDRDTGVTKNVHLFTLKWEEDLATTSNVKAQDEINKQLVERSDMCIALFWKRFGTPTEKFESGSLEEIEQFLQSGRPVIVYFITKKTEVRDIDADQLKKVQEFKKKYKDKGIYREIKNDKELSKFLSLDLTYNVDLILNKTQDTGDKRGKEKNKSGTAKTSTSKKNAPDTDPWYEVSITELINNYLHEHNLRDIICKKKLSFPKNINNWKNTTVHQFEPMKSIANKAREYAFDEKYGKYKYSKDLRSNYQFWYQPITHILQEHFRYGFHKKKILGVGANNGLELMQIFPNYKKDALKLEVLDISNVATTLGKETYKDNILFHNGNMEECHLTRNDYDLYLNLRSVHSSGVDMHCTISTCRGLLKPGGIAIFSISNGYLVPNDPPATGYSEKSGMYEISTKEFSSNKPYELATKIRSLLELYDFSKSRVDTGETEIFIYGIK